MLSSFFWIARSFLLLFFVQVRSSRACFLLSGLVCCSALVQPLIIAAHTHPSCCLGISETIRNVAPPSRNASEIVLVMGRTHWVISGKMIKQAVQNLSLGKYRRFYASRVQLDVSFLFFQTNFFFERQICFLVLCKWLFPDMLDHSWHTIIHLYLLVTLISLALVVHYPDARTLFRWKTRYRTSVAKCCSISSGLVKFLPSWRSIRLYVLICYSEYFADSKLPRL